MKFVVLLALSLPLSACSFHASTFDGPAISQDRLQVGVKQLLGQKTNSAPKSVTCDGRLNGRVDETQKCTVSYPDGSDRPVVVVVTSVNGKDIEFDIRDDTPTTTSKAA